MKTKFTYFLLVLFFTICSKAFCQDQYAFRVLANKGANTVKSPSSDQPQTVKTGVKLYKDDSLTVLEDGYLGLVHSSGKTIEIKSPGRLHVQELVSRVNGSSTSLANKYAEFVFNQMTKEGKEDVNKNSRVNNKVTGSVERGGEPIRLLAPNTTYVHGPVALIKWNGPQTTSDYVVNVKNLVDTNLLSQETKENSVIIDINDPKLKNEKLLIISVKSKTDNKIISNEVGIKKLPEEKLKNINRDFAQLQAETTEETPLNKIILATFYEQNNLLLDAITNYEAAITLAPDISDYRTAYDLFLVRNNLKK